MSQRKKIEKSHIFSSKGRPEKTLKLKLTKTEAHLLQRFLPLGYALGDYTKAPKIQTRMPAISEQVCSPTYFQIPSLISTNKVDTVVAEKHMTEPPIQPENHAPINTFEAQYQIAKEIFEIINSHKFSNLLWEGGSKSEEEVAQNTSLFQRIQQKIETREIKNETELNLEMRCLFDKIEEIEGAPSDYYDKLESLKAAYKKAREKFHLSVDCNSYALKEIQKYSKKIENYAKGQHKIHKFLTNENGEISLNFHSESLNKELLELVSTLPSIFQYELYEKISNSRDSYQKSERPIKEWIFNYCRSKLYQINPKRKKFKPTSVYRKKLARQFSARPLQFENDELNQAFSIKGDENNSESSYLSGIDQAA